MMQYIRERTNSPVVKILFFGILLSFMGLSGVSIFGNSGQDVAKVNGDKISESAARAEYDYILTYSGIESPTAEEERLLKREAVERLIDQHLLLQKIGEWGYRVSDELLAAEIQRNPNFMNLDGEFDFERYQSVLKQSRINPKDYEESIRISLAVEALQRELIDDVLLPDDLLNHWALIHNEKRDIELATLRYDAYPLEIEIGEEELLSAYDERKERLRVEPKISVAYIEITPELKENINQEEADRYLAQLIAAEDERAIEAVNRAESRLSEQLVVEYETEEEKQEAYELLDTLYQQLITNEITFTDITENLEQYPTIQHIGLGSLSRGVIGSDEVDEVLFMLTEEAPISEPFSSEGAVHLVRLEEILVSRDEAMAEVALEEYRLEGYFARESQLRELVERYPNDLDQIATELKVEVKRTGWIPRSFEGGLLHNEVVQEAIERQLIIDEADAELFELSENHGLYLLVEDYAPERLMSFDEAKPTLEAILINEYKYESLKRDLDELQDRLIEDPTYAFDEEVIELGYTYRLLESTSRMDQALFGEFPEESLESVSIVKAFDITDDSGDEERLAFFTTAATDDGIALIRVSNIVPGSIEDYLDIVKENVLRSALNEQRSLELQALLEGLREQSEIKYYQTPFMSQQ